MGDSTPLKSASKLQGTRCLIIGGSSGVGFGVADALLASGASIVISSSSETRVAKAVQRLEQKYPFALTRISACTCDISSSSTAEVEVTRLFDQAAKGGKLDHVVYTAGDDLAVGKLEDFTLPQILQAGMVRFFGPLLVAQNARKHLTPGPASSFTLTNGVAPKRPPKDWSVVASYLAGIEGMVMGLARDLAPIRVNLVSLGAVDTELWDPIKQQGGFETVKVGMEERMATGTIGKVEHVAECYLYLMKDHNATGSIVRSDGGILLI